jgi:hypothetical protein
MVEQMAVQSVAATVGSMVETMAARTVATKVAHSGEPLAATTVVWMVDLMDEKMVDLMVDLMVESKAALMVVVMVAKWDSSAEMKAGTMAVPWVVCLADPMAVPMVAKWVPMTVATTVVRMAASLVDWKAVE